MRVFMVKTQSKHFCWVGKPTGCGPLIVKLPALPDESGAFAKTVRASKNNDNQMTRKNCDALTLLNYFGFAIGGKNQTLACARGASGFNAIDAACPDEFVCVSQKVMQFLTAAVKRDLAFFLRNIETEARLIHCVAGQARDVLGS